MDIVWKSLVGAAMTGLITWLAKKGNVLPGVLPLFPTFGLIALFIVGLKNDPDAFKTTCIAALKTVPAYVAFLMVSYAAAGKVDFKIALLLGLAAWLIVALLTFWLPKYVG
ncbi:MAG: GlpM family protein [Anaerolineae bacterium]|nr:GlpM family protein [Anaerolineae bacterium]